MHLKHFSLETKVKAHLLFKPLKEIFVAYNCKWIGHLKAFLKITRGKQLLD